MDIFEMIEADARAAAELYDGVGLTELGTKALDLEELIADAEAKVKLLKKDLEQIMRYAIPQALTAAGIPEFGFEYNGGTARVSRDMKVVGSLRNAPDEEAAVSYLEHEGFIGGVKSTITIDFTEDERDRAEALVGEIEDLAGKYPHLSRSVHPQTLAAFARERLKDHPDFDLEKVGLQVIPQAKFTKRR